MQNLSNLFENIVERISQLTVEQVTKANNYQNEALIGESREFNVLFPAGFLYHSLAFIPSALSLKTEKLKSELESFFKSEISAFGFNYFTRQFLKEHKELKLPNDVDDTALILSAFAKNKQYIDERAIIGLINLETQPGGPYKTWYVAGNDSRWHDVDPFVNAHIIYFLGLLNISLPNTRNYVLEHLKNDSANSPYYPYRMFFFMSVAKYSIAKDDSEVSNVLKKKLSEVVFEKLTISEQLLFIHAKTTLSEKLTNNEHDFLERLANQKEFPEIIACLDFAQRNKMTYTASKVFGMALWVEVAAKLLNTDTPVVTGTSKHEGYLNNVWNLTVQNLSAVDVKQLLKKFPIKDTTIPLLLPLFVANSYLESLSEIQQKQLTTISSAAYIGWAGFTIIDDGVDTNKPRNIEKGKALVEKSLELIEKTFVDTKTKMFHNRLKKLARETFSWYEFEVLHRLETLKPSEYKEFINGTHILKKTQAFIFILAHVTELLTGKNDSKQAKVITDLLKSIMILRQLGDDAHDWQLDIKEGTPTIATVQLKGKDPTSRETIEYYWTNISPQIVSKCDYHFKKASVILGKYSNLKTLEPILKKAYAPIIELKKELKGIKKILKFYSK